MNNYYPSFRTFNYIGRRKAVEHRAVELNFSRRICGANGLKR
jgi:hypothetical protein